MDLLGDRYRFLITGQQTGGRYTLMEVTIGDDDGLPDHSHLREIEAYFVLEGRVALQLNGTHRTLELGAFVQIPPATTHSYGGHSPGRAKDSPESFTPV